MLFSRRERAVAVSLPAITSTLVALLATTRRTTFNLGWKYFRNTDTLGLIAGS